MGPFCRACAYQGRWTILPERTNIAIQEGEHWNAAAKYKLDKQWPETEEPPSLLPIELSVVTTVPVHCGAAGVLPLAPWRRA